MIGELKPYANYADSGPDWLGSVPAHWGLLRAKRLFREVDERSATGEEELLSVSHITGVTPRRLKTVTMFMAESNVGHKVCRPDDLVINTLWAWMGALGVTRHMGIVSPAYGVYRPLADGGMLPAYADHLLRTPLYAAEYQRRSTGVNSSRLRLYPEQFLRMPVLVPPVAEQTAIVRFLDWTSGRLDRAIRAKRNVIALLNEQKQGVVHLTVTRGLDPTVPLKPSGVAWLGDIPSHWDLRPLKTLLSKNDGGVWGSNFDANGTIVLRSTEQAIDGAWQINSPAVIRLTAEQIGAALLAEGDLVVTKSSGSPKHIGKASLVTREIAQLRCCYSNFMQRLRTTESLAPEYLTLFLNGKAGRMHYQYSSTSTTGLGNLTRQTIAALPVPTPPRDEQIKNLEQLRVELAPLDLAVARLRREIELVREYRSRLVVDVVTGKLDVREAARGLPEQTAPAADVVDETEDAALSDEGVEV